MFLRMLFVVALVSSTPLWSQDRIVTPSDGAPDGSWVVSIPGGSSDFFNTRLTAQGGVVSGIHVAVADFGTTVSAFPSAGVYRSNLAFDPSGITPDLASPISAGGPLVFTPGLAMNTTQLFAIPPAPAEPDMHTVVQLPPGDPGLLAIGADSDTIARDGGECGTSLNPFDASSFTMDGYATLASAFTSGDFAMGPLIQGGTDGVPSLAVSSIGPSGEVSGDFDLLTTREGEGLGLSFWGDAPGGTPNQWLLFLSASGLPLISIGSPVSSTPIGNGFTNTRLITSWPRGAGDMTLNFIAVAGSPGVIGSVGISNEITICSLADEDCVPGAGYDDGTYESGWVVAIPAGSSDYFSTLWGVPTACVLPLSESSYAVMDFGTSATAFPRSGQAPANFGVDPSGLTPDISNPYVDTPISFPPLTFVTTFNQLIRRTFSGYTPAAEVIEFIQFPVGDLGLLGVGADTNSFFIAGVTGWSIDGFSSPANIFSAGNWGMRTQ